MSGLSKKFPSTNWTTYAKGDPPTILSVISKGLESAGWLKARVEQSATTFAKDFGKKKFYIVCGIDKDGISITVFESSVASSEIFFKSFQIQPRKW